MRVAGVEAAATGPRLATARRRCPQVARTGPGRGSREGPRGARAGRAAAAERSDAARSDLLLEGTGDHAGGDAGERAAVARLGAVRAGAYVERVTRAWRQVDEQAEANDERRRHARRELRTWADDDGMVVIRGRLTPEVGAVVRRALETADDRLRSEAPVDDARSDSEPETSPRQRRADAPGLLAEAALEADLDRGTAGDRYQVVLPVEADALRSDAGDSAPDVPAETPCSAARPDVPAETRPDRASAGAPRCARCGRRRAERYRGDVVLRRATGRSRGDVPAGGPRGPRGGRRAARLRGDGAADGVRRVGRGDAARAGPLRPRRGAQDAHHPAGARPAVAGLGPGLPLPGLHRPALRCAPRRHRADGGATRLDNLVLLCRQHQRAVHEEGFTVALDASGEAAFRWPDGRPFPAAPAAPAWSGPALAPTDVRLAAAGIAIGPASATPHWPVSSLGVPVTGGNGEPARAVHENRLPRREHLFVGQRSDRVELRSQVVEAFLPTRPGLRAHAGARLRGLG